ncbi:general secretion pathway protein GspB [Polaromonas sp. P1(28)-8]|nr:general secretion pathway protein GspB [Polaromonas sp. P1(28)-8]
MSYILDALRKADAQRERDPAQGIHAQPLQMSALDPPEGHQSRLWLGGAAVIGAGLLAVAAWQLAGPAAPPVAVSVAPPVAHLPAAEAGIAPAPAVIRPPPVPMAAPALPATEVLPAAPLPAAPVAPAAAPLREARKPAPALAASSPAPAAAAPDRLLSVNELPADVQRDLPKLAISGGVYSANPAQRMLIVNGQVVGEGAEPAPGVVLEQIRARTAVLRYRGYRYAVAY